MNAPLIKKNHSKHSKQNFAHFPYLKKINAYIYSPERY